VSTHLALSGIDVEKSVQDVRPDLLGHTDEGLLVAIELAYSCFCEMSKVDQFARLGLPALEIDLRAFTPEEFDPGAVRAAVLNDVSTKSWLWPTPPAMETPPAPVAPFAPPTLVTVEAPRARLPEEIVTISGRWVSIKTFLSGDLAVKVVTYDPDVVSLVKSIAKANYGRYSPKWKSWNVPRWRADIVRAELRAKSGSVSIVLQDRA
jgi:competence protein CoiA